MARAARTSGPSMGPLHVQLYTERLPTLLRCSGHQETSGSNAAASALKSGGIAGTLLDVAMISCDQKRGGTVSHFVKGSRWLTWRAPRLWCPCQLPLLAGPVHGRTIPLADIRQP